MKTRILEIRTFKNIIGKNVSADCHIENSRDVKPQTLLLDAVINTNGVDTKLGGLVIIIGENNTGKSNVSRALEKFIRTKNPQNTFSESDKPNFDTCTNCEPILTLKTSYIDFTINPEISNKDMPNYTQEFSTKIIYSNGRVNIHDCQGSAHEIKAAEMQQKEDKQKALQDEIEREIRKLKRSNIEIYNELKDKFIHPADNQNIKDLEHFKTIYNEQINLIKNAKDKVQQSQTYDETKKAYIELEKVINNAVRIYNASPCISKPINIKTQFIIPKVFDNVSVPSNNTKHNIRPKVIKYDNSKNTFTSKDLETTIDSIESSKFFQSLARAAKIDIQKDIIQPFKHHGSKKDYLPRIESKINKKLKDTIEKRFNKLYKKKGDLSYEFEINLYTNEIAFSISRNKKQDVLELDLQSEGFKWFFNLFFGLLYGENTLSKNSIVLMDEPAHNLSVPARKGCRDFLKSYGEKHGITFVVVTHDPFLVDIDNLDELRIITNMHSSDTIAEGKGVNISNDFSVIEREDSNALTEIKKAFGVSSHFFYNPGMRIVFVEGITDYNYLTTFKILKQKEGGECNIAFLPIGGLGASDADKEQVIENLIHIFPEPILLVDSDMAGRKFKKIKAGENKKRKPMDKLHIVELREIDSNLREIEDCFSDIDFETYRLDKKIIGIESTQEEKRKNPVKNSQKSKAMKREILCNKGTISKEAKDRFYKILEFLEFNV
ncbi:AAA family ATPase [Helicobacter saguini]|uniref:AAA family ATPase n=1 Tax=Helicobacter saguini TaxID=1548018 RepID=A0A347VQ76_9HELI|nr:AAA family ATPase [Helicobacter saguini]MWV61047.1 AAA family ATPase [Helicobacter saguini]MWV68284.1 AAA family ATPase [Helicobacter saguini]MWV70251.1 AAA family ATPase [Helicobacter saguini]TLD95215.1 hypothetical protein LS64_002290 [Helicobacter saguini]